ncbi:RNA polymerase sigma-70 factor (ECF subfamily) [Saccharomonospora amisosensis]|uniref:RNA polymerase sigma-70 factor (ECF subfamily) n=1 Tax=Saccharomonospora amisosensis TaxID=1128677 RepID=A0A7X5UNC2_9PSEU|nr:sigma-70 family RNA polymerase sigma factor [Saccharomonospora amisosensis]NIJ11180.1 RNA polymerase sigma-70 factor (ECF subfamily) [Saccharomonospora amisosensis]
MELVEQFEAARPRLVSLAYRILGSHHDAEDVVQSAWLRVQDTGLAELANPAGYFTTVTTRLCLDQLRIRERRGELPLLSSELPTEQVSADEAYLRREDVSRALLVLLAELSPSQRVAFVLHDLFAVPFAQIADVLDTSPASAKKLASRARERLRGARPGEGGHSAEHFEIIEAFLVAARDGDITRLVTLLAPDAVRTADPLLLPARARVEVRGARAVAEETRAFADRIAAAVPVLVHRRPGALIAPGGHPYAFVHFEVQAGLVVRVEIIPYQPGAASLAAVA